MGPDAINTAQWSQPADGPDFLHDLVEALKAKYPINPRRVYLFGHSAGAVFALGMSLIQSEYYAATAVHAGAWRERDDDQVARYAKRKIPLAIWIGTNDQYFPLKDARSTRDALQSEGIPIELHEMAGHDHWYYDLAPQINKDAWEFLKKHELPGDPRYEVYGSANDADAANVIIREVAAVQTKINELLQQVNLKELELKKHDFNSERAEIARLGP
ncbi:MAG: dienelactone hydrolase family protein [Pyrinomonadaceae bacterium]